MAHDDEPAVPALEIDEFCLDQDLWLIELTGELDVATVEQFKAAMSRVVDGGARTIVVDLVHLTFLDSSGLATMLGALRTVELVGGRLLVACANPTVLRLFQITRTDTTFEIVPSRERALQKATAARQR